MCRVQGGKSCMDLNIGNQDRLKNRLRELAEKFHVTESELASELARIHCEDLMLLKRYPVDIDDTDSIEMKVIGVIGSETIGRGIAKIMAVRGVRVVMIGDSDRDVTQSMEYMHCNLDWLITKWELTETEKKLILQNIHATSDFGKLTDVDIVFDTTRLTFDRKVALYQKLDHTISPCTIVAIDDETCPLERISNAISQPDRLIGFHFVYPVSRRKIVEITPIRTTSADVIRRMAGVSRFLEKEFVVLHETIGGISTRIMAPFINEAIRLWSEGCATAHEIDRVMRLSMNLPMGPLEYADTIGLDAIFQMMESMWRFYGMPQFKPPERLGYMVRSGMLGKKAGQGFHSYKASQIGEVL